MSRGHGLLLASVLAALGCENAGADRTLGITATGIVKGQVYFDANGSRTLDAADVGVAGAQVRLLSPGGLDTLVRITAVADGSFRLDGVPVGAYLAVVDSASSAGDSAIVLAGATQAITVLPGDSVVFTRAVSYPLRTIAEARAAAPGTRLFVRAVALHARETFSDTTLHVVDATGAMRATRVRPITPGVVAGDSVVLRARIGTRLGQVVLDDVTPFVVTPTIIPLAAVITTAAAATAGPAGALDAALVRLLDAQVLDTATVSGDLQMTMDDGSGPVVVILDRTADAGFRPPLPPNLYVPTNRFDLSGVLVPAGAGVWRVKPRSALDLTVR